MVNSRGEPVAEAIVVLIDGHDPRELGLTTSAGLLEVPLWSTLTDGDIIFASKAGEGRGQRTVSIGHVAECVIRLDSISAIGGVVRSQSAKLADASGLTVVAIPSDLSFVEPPSNWTRILQDPRVLIGNCEADGSFSLVGASTHLRYRVTVGGRGWVHTSGPVTASSQSGMLELIVAALYGVRISLQGIDGLAITPARVGGQEWGVTSQIHADGAELGLAHPVALGLAGVPDAWLTESRAHYVLTATSADEVEAIGPAEIGFSFLGYQPLQVTTMLKRVGAPLQDQPALLLASSNGFGSLRLDLSESGVSTAMIGSPGFLMLQRPDGKILRFPLGGMSPRDYRIASIPAEPYRWRFIWNPDVPARSRETRDWQPCRVQADAEVVLKPTNQGAGALTIDLLQDDGSPYTGPAQFLLGELDQSQFVPDVATIRGDTISFSRVPYRVPSLPPGPIVVQLISPGTSNGTGPIPTTISTGEQILSMRWHEPR